jgi:hypothetical protein
VIVSESSMPAIVSRDRAMRSLITHGFSPGVGYIDYGAPLPVPSWHGQSANGNDCRPTAGTPNGSYHMLKVGMSEPLVFVWVAREHAWGRMGGHRLAFTPQYLAANGWAYIRPATLQDMRTDLQRGMAIQFKQAIMQDG